MKKPLYFLVSILISFSVFGQKNKDKDSNIPAFGKVEKADLELKECDFDKKAEAMVLFDKGQLDYILGRGIDLIRHTRIKILNEKGKDRADVHLVYHSWENDESIQDISAQVYNLDPSGNIVVTKLEKSQVFEKKLNKYFTEKVFTFPEVKPGSVIEYKYKHRNIGMINWYFQRTIPVKYSEFTFDYPNAVSISFLPKCYMNYVDKSDNSNSRTVRFFSMSDVPALRDEPFILNEDDYMQKIESKTVARQNDNGLLQSIVVTWPQVIRHLAEHEDFGVQIKKEIPRTSDLDAELKTTKDPYSRMKIIYNYVRKNMQWNEYSGIWSYEGVKAAWKDKKGTAGEINLILVNLLKDAGLNAKPILVSTHDNGLVNSADAGTTRNPGYNQFNKVLAWVTIEGNKYALDATDKETPVDLIPPDVVATEGLVISKIETFEWGWEMLWRENLKYQNMILLIGTIDTDGKLTGDASINSVDYARLERISTARKGKKEFTEKYFSSNNPDITIDSISLENLDMDDQPLIQKVYFNQQLNSSGDYKYFSTNLFTGLEKNPFVADERISDVFFGVLQTHTVIANITIPDGYEFEELPKNVKMIMPDTSIAITRLSQANDRKLSMRINLEFKKPFYTAPEYDAFKEFYKKLFDMLNEQFVIKKKAKP